jgi:hypothetical protein
LAALRLQSERDVSLQQIRLWSRNTRKPKGFRALSQAHECLRQQFRVSESFLGFLGFQSFRVLELLAVFSLGISLCGLNGDHP